MTNVIQLPQRPGAVPTRIRIEHASAIARIPALYAKCQRLGLPLYARRLREVNEKLGGKPLPILSTAGAL